MVYSLTRALGRWAAGSRGDDVSEAARSTIRTAFVDAVGALLAGRDAPATRILVSVLPFSTGETHVLFGPTCTSAPDAAWINGTAVHALDYDDVDTALRGHPSAVLVPAILAEGEAVGASGQQLILAYAVGHEVWAELAWRDRDLQHNKGWHPTSVFGAIGAAAACSSLLHLGEDEASSAIALAASQSAGLVANFGTMTKPFQVGRAAHAGVMSARLASRGYTASPDAIERDPGFLGAISLNGHLDLRTPVDEKMGWKSRYSVKKYPICYCAHRLVDGALDIVAAARPDPADIERIVITTSARNIAVMKHHVPATGLQAKFSLEFAMACAFLVGRVGLGETRDDFVNREDVQALMKRVVAAPTGAKDPLIAGYALFDTVALEMKSGARFESGPVSSVRGDAGSPLARGELWQKFRDSAAVGGMDRPQSLFDALMALDDLAMVRDLYQLAA